MCENEVLVNFYMRIVTMNTESKTYPDLMTEEELVKYLRVPEVSKSNNYHNVIEHLKRMRDLPRIHLCSKALCPLDAIRDWIKKETMHWR